MHVKHVYHAKRTKKKKFLEEERLIKNSPSILCISGKNKGASGGKGEKKKRKKKPTQNFNASHHVTVIVAIGLALHGKRDQLRGSFYTVLPFNRNSNTEWDTISLRL